MQASWDVYCDLKSSINMHGTHFQCTDNMYDFWRLLFILYPSSDISTLPKQALPVQVTGGRVSTIKLYALKIREYL